MAIYLEPHTSEWFEALLAFDPRQATFIGQILACEGRKDVCSFCGDHPAEVYKIVKADDPIPANAVATARLCEDCIRIRKRMYREEFEPWSGTDGSGKVPDPSASYYAFGQSFVCLTCGAKVDHITDENGTGIRFNCNCEAAKRRR